MCQLYLETILHLSRKNLLLYLVELFTESRFVKGFKNGKHIKVGCQFLPINNQNLINITTM